jgi:hypothetical protein
MRGYKEYRGRKERLTPFYKFLIVLFLSVTIPAAITGQLQDGPGVEASAPVLTEESAVPELSDKVYESLSRISSGTK